MDFAAETFASRAGHRVRDELGLAYYVFSTLGSSRGQSPWTVRMGVNPVNVERAVSVTLEELRKIVDGKVAPADLALAQDKLVGELDVARESPGGVAAQLLEGELFELGPDHVERYPRELRAVTRQQVVETARRLLPPERHALAIAGPPLPEAARAGRSTRCCDALCSRRRCASSRPDPRCRRRGARGRRAVNLR